MDKQPKPKKVKPQIRIMRADLKDMIRDELYGYQISLPGFMVVMIPISDVKKLASRIAKRAIIGH